MGQTDQSTNFISYNISLRYDIQFNVMIFFLAFAIIIDTVAGANPGELQTLRLSPASIFLITEILVCKVTVFLIIFAPFCKREQSVFLLDIMGGKITINLKEVH